jgi:hypothetical protein
MEFARSVDRQNTLLATLMRERLTLDLQRQQPAPFRPFGSRARVTASATLPKRHHIEDPSGKFCLGVQWHPENFFRTGEFRPLFEGFLQAATRT